MRRTEPPPVFNPRIGMYFALLCIVFLALSFLHTPYTLILLWPALAMLIIAFGYWFVGPAVFYKNNGRISLFSTVLLGPYFIGQHIYWRNYFSKCRPWDEPVPNLLIGRFLTEKEALSAVMKENIVAVVDMTAEFSETQSFREISYLNLQTMDLTAPHYEYLLEGAKFISKAIQSGKVYVHCKIGYSRSAAMVGSYLMYAGIVDSIEEAIAVIKKVRPSLIVRPEARAALEFFHAVCHNEHK